jgi:IS30 family transposase
MNKSGNKHKHLTYDDRLEIQNGLSRGMTFKAISTAIGKDPTTVSKEVKKRLSIVPSTTKHLNRSGQPVSVPPCSILLKAPFVCNGCSRRRVRCAYEKQIYDAKHAQKEYEAMLSDAREGVALNREQFYEMDRIVYDGIKKGQHLYHISQTHDLGISKSSVYRHLHRGHLSVSAVDFPRVVKFKPRQKRQEPYVPKAVKAGRTYDDFLGFIEKNGIPAWVEMDTLIGRIGGKTIMTFDFTFCNFMPGLLLPDKTAAALSGRVTDLKRRFAENNVRFGDVIPLALTDNGGEFSDVSAIENDLSGFKETDLFFCDPMRSDQKARIEKNHTLFRDIVPKGSSFDHFTQDTVDLIFSHVNSVKRKSLNGKSPYELFAFTYGEAVPAMFGVSPIPANDVIQSPLLLKGVIR